MHERTVDLERAVDRRETPSAAGVKYPQRNGERAVALSGSEVARLLAEPSLGRTERVEAWVWERPASQTEDRVGRTGRFGERLERHAADHARPG